MTLSARRGGSGESPPGGQRVSSNMKEDKCISEY